MNELQRVKEATLNTALALSQGSQELAREYATQAAEKDRTIASLQKTVACLNWLQFHHTLHTQVEIVYTVDGYEVTRMHEDGTPLSVTFKGETLEEAVQAAIDADA